MARSEGKSDNFFGKGLGDDVNFPYTLFTVAITTEIKRLLPEEGRKWLFLRLVSKAILNDRTDYDIVVHDQQGNLIATSQHILMVIPIGAKSAKNKDLSSDSGTFR